MRDQPMTVADALDALAVWARAEAPLGLNLSFVALLKWEPGPSETGIYTGGQHSRPALLRGWTRPWLL